MVKSQSVVPDIILLLAFATAFSVLLWFFPPRTFVAFVSLAVVVPVDTYFKWKLRLGIDTAFADMCLASTIFVVGTGLSRVAGETSTPLTILGTFRPLLFSVPLFAVWLASLHLVTITQSPERLRRRLAGWIAFTLALISLIAAILVCDVIWAMN